MLLRHDALIHIMAFIRSGVFEDAVLFGFIIVKILPHIDIISADVRLKKCIIQVTSD